MHEQERVNSRGGLELEVLNCDHKHEILLSAISDLTHEE